MDEARWTGNFMQNRVTERTSNSAEKQKIKFDSLQYIKAVVLNILGDVPQ